MSSVQKTPTANRGSALRTVALDVSKTRIVPARFVSATNVLHVEAMRNVLSPKHHAVRTTLAPLAKRTLIVPIFPESRNASQGYAVKHSSVKTGTMIRMLLVPKEQKTAIARVAVAP